MTNLERRAFSGAFRVETREEGRKRIEGHAAVFNQDAEIFGFTERIAPGAFAEAIGRDDVRALFNHDPNFVLGRNKAGTLELREDATGLFISNVPPDAQWARDLLASIERGDISQMSFGFRTIEDEWSTKDGVPHRTIKKVELFDVSPVTFPAYPQTDVGVALRSMHEWQKQNGGSGKEPGKEDPEALERVLGCADAAIRAAHREHELALNLKRIP